MMYKAFYKRGGHASVMEEIKTYEIIFLYFFEKVNSQHQIAKHRSFHSQNKTIQ